MAYPWFKFYGIEYLADQKMLSLSAPKRSCWITLLSYASQTNGVIKHLDESSLMLQSGMDATCDYWEETVGVLKWFEKLEMIHIDNEVITILNWGKRQEKQLTGYERVKKYREKKKNDNTMITLDKKKIRIDKIREESKIATSSPTPKDISLRFFSGEYNDEQESIISMLVDKGIPESVARAEMKKFVSYWTEKNQSGTKQRWEQEKTFEVKRRLTTWFSKINTFQNKSNNKIVIA